MSRKSQINYIITGALIAAAYAGLTFLSNVTTLAYIPGPIQLRFSEILTILPVFTPAAIPGLTVGCFIANIGSFNAVDMIFGSVATLLSALLTYMLKGIKIKGIPFLSFLMPVVVNAFIIGLELALFLPGNATLWGFAISALEVGVGEFIMCVILGTFFYLVVKKYRIFEKNFYKKR